MAISYTSFAVVVAARVGPYRI